jgi:DNA-binding NarL/FixJ family response regulator
MDVPATGAQGAVGLLEREFELEALAAALLGASAGPGAAVLIEGPAGAGKSTLLDWAAGSARERGLTVLRAVGSPLDASVPFGIARQLFDRALGTAEPEARAAALAGMAAPAAAVLEPDPAGGRDPAGPDEPVHALYWLTVNLSAGGGLVLLVDDAHLADRASLRFLEYLARRMEELPATLVLAARPAGPEAPAELTQLRTRLPVVLTPRPLSAAAVGTMVEARLGTPDRDFLATFHEASGGSPLLAAELIGALAGERVAPTAAAATVLGAAPDGVRRRLEATLAQLGPGARELGLATLVLERAPLDLAAALAELEPAEAAGLADGLRAAGIIAAEEPLRFTHAVHAQALRAGVGDAELAEWHRRAAVLLERRGEGAEATAPHLLLSVPAGSEATATTLREAARSALRRGAPEAAVGYLDRALAEAPESAAEPGIALELATALGTAGRWDEAATALARGLRSPHADPLRPELTVALGRAEHFAGRYEDSVGTLREAVGLAAAGPERDAAVADLLALGLMDADARRSVDGLIEEGRAAWRAGDLEDGPLPAMVATADVLACLPAAEARAALTRRLAALDVDRSVDDDLSLGWALLALDAADGTPEALDFVGRALAAARWRGDRRAVVYHLVMEGWMLYRLGRIHEALAAADEARAAAEAIGAGLDQSTFTLQAESLCLAHILVERDEPDEALALARAAAVDNPTAEYLATVRHVEGRAELGRGRPAAALAQLEAAGAVLAGLDIRNPIFNGWRVAAVPAALAAGREEAARAHAEALTSAADSLGVASLRVRALQARALLAGETEARDLLDEALELAAAGPYRLDEASVLLQTGLCLTRADDADGAREPLRAALDLADRLGATATAASAREALVAAGGRPRRAALSGLASLSPAELRVARLAAEGMKNREIAEHLFVTLKTVEMHLSSTYGKLEVKGRPGLASAFAADR